MQSLWRQLIPRDLFTHRAWIVLLLLAGCSLDRTDVDRVASPNQRTVAVQTLLVGGGAAGTQSFEVNLAATDGEIRPTNPVLSSVGKVNLRWLDDSTLVASYDPGCKIFGFRSQSWSWPTEGSGKARRIEIILERVPGMESGCGS